MSAEHRFKLVVVGGGAGGCATAHKFVSRWGPGEVCVIEPSSDHYYQPMWTLVGGGVKTLEQSVRPMQSLLPRQATWLRDSVETFHPDTNTLVTAAGDTVSYDWLVIATGIQLRWQIQIHINIHIQVIFKFIFKFIFIFSRYDKIKGLPEAFDTPGVGSNYSYKYVEKTQRAIKEFVGGVALFTLPSTPIKCAGWLIYETCHFKTSCFRSSSEDHVLGRGRLEGEGGEG